MSTTVPDPERAAAPEVEPQAYNAFIGQIQLQAIWLARTTVVNRAGPTQPAQATFGIRDESRWEPSQEGFVAYQTYFINLSDGDTQIMAMTVEFGLTYNSAIPLTDAIFALFRGVNLPLNVWPYLREYLADTLGRMNWAPFTLPVFRVNTPPPKQEARAEPSKRRRQSRQKTTEPAE